MPPLVENDPAVPRHPDQSPDPRHPLYLGDWKRSVPYIDDDIAIDDLDEPHMKRKVAILKRHPEIEALYGTDIRTAYIACLTAAAQIAVAYFFGRVYTSSWLALLLGAYFIGATFTAVYGVIIHEATHCLAANGRFANRIVGLIANIALPVPIAMSFRRYHLEHHTFQGVVGMDPDLPLEWEKTLIRGNSFLKALWIFIYPAMYVIRGAAMNKKPTTWELINMAFTIVCDVLITRLCGWRGLSYLVASVWFGYSLHPGAAHFVQEHYTFDDGQETYSYYGFLNYVFMNIGYHNEHHDFTKVCIFSVFRFPFFHMDVSDGPPFAYYSSFLKPTLLTTDPLVQTSCCSQNCL